MKRLCPVIMLALLVGCRASKETSASARVEADSVAHSASHRASLAFDSLAQSISFAFDTLEVRVDRQCADTTRTVRLRAVKGRVTSHRKQERLAAEALQRSDTVAYKLAAAKDSAEHSATTRVYDPPNMAFPLIVALIVIAGIAFLLIGKKI